MSFSYPFLLGHEKQLHILPTISAMLFPIPVLTHPDFQDLSTTLFLLLILLHFKWNTTIDHQYQSPGYTLQSSLTCLPITDSFSCGAHVHTHTSPNYCLFRQQFTRFSQHIVWVPLIGNTGCIFLSTNIRSSSKLFRELTDILLLNYHFNKYFWSCNIGTLTVLHSYTSKTGQRFHSPLP